MRKMNENDFNHMVTFFDKMAQTSWLSHVHAYMVQLIEKKKKYESVLDVGCGTGRLLHKLLVQFERAYGIDLSPEMIKEAQALAQTLNMHDRLTFIEGDAYELPFSDDTFDTSVSTCVLFLLPNPLRGIKEMVRVTKSGGHVLMLNPSPLMNEQNAKTYAQSHSLSDEEAVYLYKWSNVSMKRHRLTTEELIETFEHSGLIDTKVIPVLDGLAHISMARKSTK